MGIVGISVGGRSVCRRSHWQFQRSPGRWCDQKGSLTGRTVYQNMRWSSPGCRAVDCTHSRLGNTSASSANCCHLVAKRERCTAVAYSVRSQAPLYLPMTGVTSRLKSANLLILPLSSSNRDATSLCKRCVRKAEKIALLRSRRDRKSAEGGGTPRFTASAIPVAVARLKTS